MQRHTRGSSHQCPEAYAHLGRMGRAQSREVQPRRADQTRGPTAAHQQLSQSPLAQPRGLGDVVLRDSNRSHCFNMIKRVFKWRIHILCLAV